MKIKSIEIQNLFEIFNYNISFKKDENVLIITGPNGFGKTMVLNIIFNLFNRKFLFFQKLVFEKITLTLDENIKVIILKTITEGKSKISFSFYEKDKLENDKLIETFDYSTKLELDFERTIDRYLPVHKISDDKWIDHRTDRILNLEELLNEYADQLPDKFSKNLLRIKSTKVNSILDSIQVHFENIKLDGIQIFIYLNSTQTGYDDFEAFKDGVNLEILKVLESENVKLSYPGQNIYIKEKPMNDTQDQK